MKKQRTILITAVFFSLLLSCKQKKEKTVSFSPVKVGVFICKSRKVNKKIITVGTILPGIEINIYSGVTGILKRIYADTGTNVKRNQVLFEIDRRFKGIDYRTYKITAPLQGMVLKLYKNTGDMVIENNTVIAKIIKPDIYTIDFSINLKDFDKINSDKVTFFHPGFPNKIFHAKIFRTSQRVNTADRKITVSAKVLNSSARFYTGRQVQIILSSKDKKNGIHIPSRVVSNEDNLNYVYVFNKKLGIAYKKYIEIESYGFHIVNVKKGLIPGEMIIDRNKELVFDGMKIQLSSIAESGVNGELFNIIKDSAQ